MNEVYPYLSKLQIMIHSLQFFIIFVQYEYCYSINGAFYIAMGKRLLTHGKNWEGVLLNNTFIFFFGKNIKWKYQNTNYMLLYIIQCIVYKAL